MKFLLTFFLLVLTLPAAAQTLSGKLATSENIEQAIGNSTVRMTDTVTGEVRLSSVNQLGYFRFPGIVFGRRYDLEVRSKRYTFGRSSVVSFSDQFGIVLTGQRNFN